LPIVNRRAGRNARVGFAIVIEKFTCRLPKSYKVEINYLKTVIVIDQTNIYPINNSVISYIIKIIIIILIK
jgi:hypothetical protein